MESPLAFFLLELASAASQSSPFSRQLAYELYSWHPSSGGIRQELRHNAQLSTGDPSSRW